MLRRFLVLGLAAATGGCGTMANMAGREYPLMGPPTQTAGPFGGAANDLRWVRTQAGRVVEPEDVSDVPAGVVLAGYFAFIDLPLSVVGDVLTLPAVVPGGQAAGPPLGGPLPEADQKFAPQALGLDVPVLTAVEDRDKYVDQRVAVRGVVSKTKLPTIAGVLIDTPDELRDREAYAVGVLVRWTVTEAEYAEMQGKFRKDGNVIGIAHPGPGVYYKLEADLTGKLAEARPLPKGAGK